MRLLNYLHEDVIKIDIFKIQELLSEIDPETLTISNILKHLNDKLKNEKILFLDVKDNEFLKNKSFLDFIASAHATKSGNINVYLYMPVLKQLMKLPT